MMKEDTAASQKVCLDWLNIYERLEHELSEAIKNGHNLTISLQNGLLNCMRQARSARTTLTMISHHLADVESFADYEPLEEITSLFQEPY